MDDASFREFKRSLYSCTAHPGFSSAFYKRLFAASEELEAHFMGLEMDRQKRLFKASLHISLRYAQEDPLADTYLEYLGKKHRGFPPEYYEVWIATLLETVAVFDDQYTEATERAWREVMHPVVERMSTP